VFADIPAPCGDGFLYKGRGYALSLKGAYQPCNAAAVIEIINALRRKGFKVSEDALEYGLSHTEWKARFEYVGKNVIIDGAHNPDGIAALKKSLLALDKRIILVMAMMADKNYADCIRDISEIAECTVAAEVNTERSLKAAEIGAVLEKSGAEYKIIPDIRSAVAEAVRLAGEDGIVCVCGSLYLAGEAEKFFSKSTCK